MVDFVVAVGSSGQLVAELLALVEVGNKVAGTAAAWVVA